MKKCIQNIATWTLLCFSIAYLNAQEKNILVAQNGRVENLNAVDNRYAFIIGNDHYRSNEISSLSSCRLDAVRFGSFLKSSSGWRLPKKNIRLMLDATQQDLEQGLIELLRKIDQPENSTVYFYYSGHGVPGSIVPTDFDKDRPETLVSYAWIKDQINKRKINAQVFVIDACYSGSIISMKDPMDFNKIYSNLMENQRTTEKFAVFTAANAYRVTPAGRHESLYTKYFMKAIESDSTDSDKDGVLRAGEIYEVIEKEIGSLSSPQFAGNDKFPIASLVSDDGRNSGNGTAQFRATISRTEVSSTAAMESAVLWRKSVENMTGQMGAIQEMISNLEAEKSPRALAQIGFLYRQGIGVEQNINKALQFFISAASEGDRFAEYNLGYLYSKGLGLEQNAQKAMTYYMKAAEKGDPFAQNNLGSAYSQKDGDLCEFNFDKSVHWFQKAADQGHVKSQIALGKLYKLKADWTSNKKRKKALYENAVHWLDLASKENHSQAQYELANCYEFGLGVDKDLTKSKFWYKQACNNDMYRSCRKLMLLAKL